MIAGYKNISFLGIATAFPLLACVQKPTTSDQLPKPNIIYVFPDQMRNSAMEFWGNPQYAAQVRFKADPVVTPNLNKFASQSVVFSSAISNCPLSSPHRGSLFTGLYPNKSGVPLNVNITRPISSLRDDATTISDVYRAQGYNCAYIGKYHLDYPTPNDPQNPGQYVENRKIVWDAYTPPEKRHGFDFWYSYGTFDVHKQPHYWDTQGKKHEIREWSPKHETDVAIDYLKNRSGVRDTSKPFFMVVSYNPPHHPYNSLDDCMEQDYNLYKDKPLSELLVRPNADTTRAKAHSAAYYFAQVSGVDREFGRLLNALDSLKLSDNTIVVFASDHGETMCSHGIDDPKNSPYTESVNTPFIIRYPKKLKPNVVDYMLSTPDIMPTLLGLSGLNSYVPKEVQGYDFSEVLLTGKAQKPIPENAVYIKNIDGEKDKNENVTTYFPVERGIITHKYTLTLTIDKASRKLKSIILFDNQADPYQMNNLNWELYPEVKKELLAQLATLLKNIDDPWYKEKILKDIIPYQ